jgi:hypothetical protein
MEQKSRWGLLSKRNILGAVLVAGIVAGVYLADFWKGFGGGSSLGIGIGDKSQTATTTTDAKPDGTYEDIAATPHESPTVVKVVIANWSYALRTADGEQPVELSQIVELAKSAKGDDDGIRVRIYRKLSSRAKAETDLESALTAAGIQEKEIVFMPTPNEER